MLASPSENPSPTSCPSSGPCPCSASTWIVLGAITGNMAWLVTLMAQAVLHIVGILLIRKSCRQLGLGRTSRTTTRSLALSTHRLGRLRSLALGQTCLNSRPLKSCILSDGIECCPTLTHRVSAAHLLKVRLEPSSIPLDLDSLVSDLIT